MTAEAYMGSNWDTLEEYSTFRIPPTLIFGPGSAQETGLQAREAGVSDLEPDQRARHAHGGLAGHLQPLGGSKGKRGLRRLAGVYS